MTSTSAAIQERYRQASKKERRLILASVGHQWLQETPESKLRKRMVAWSRELTDQEVSKVTRRPITEEEAKAVKSALGALVVLDSPEQLQQIGRRLVDVLSEVKADQESPLMLEEMLRDLPAQSLGSL